MGHLWTPWRSKYILGEREPGCVFCNAAHSPEEDLSRFVVYRGTGCFVILNRYPYTSGHVMVTPYLHASRLSQIDEATASEMMQLARRVEAILQQTYRPDGINLGMNLGEAAGAGIEQHIHLHVLPRWHGDANFMTSVAQTRVLPELLEDTYQKLSAAFTETSK